VEKHEKAFESGSTNSMKSQKVSPQTLRLSRKKQGLVRKVFRKEPIMNREVYFESRVPL